MDEILVEITDNEISPVIVEQEILSDIPQTIVDIEVNPIEITAVIQQVEIFVEVNS
jgi:hypothetical protein